MNFLTFFFSAALGTLVSQILFWVNGVEQSLSLPYFGSFTISQAHIEGMIVLMIFASIASLIFPFLRGLASMIFGKVKYEH